MSKPSNTITRRTVVDDLPVTYAGDGTTTPDSANPWEVVNDRLRGRWRLALVLAILVGAGLAVLGYTMAPVQYRARGIVRVEPALPVTVDEIPETGMVPFYQQFLASQAGLIGSERVLSEALRDKRLEKYEEFRTLAALETFAANLSVYPVRNTHLVNVEYLSETPAKSVDAVNSVLDAYQRLNTSEEDYAATRRRLEALRQDKRIAITNLEDDIQKFIESSHFATAPIEEVKALKWQEKMFLQRQLTELGGSTDGGATLASGPGEQGEASPANLREGPTVQELDNFDQGLRAARRALHDMELQYEQLLRRFTENHIQVREMRENLDTASRLFEERENAVREAFLAQMPADVLVGTPAERRAAIEEQIEQIDRQLQQINHEALQKSQLERQMAQLLQDEQEFTVRLEKLTNEAPILREGRIHVYSKATAPSLPAVDRRSQLGAIGFALGAGMIMGMFLLIGTLDRRAYATAQLQGQTEYDCLGVLPDMSSRTALDPEARDLASQCVHRIRNRIENMRKPDGGFVLAITSPSQGDGKTSLSLALGWSYAASGYKTVLVDCDFIGRSLSLQTGRLGRDGLKEVIRSQRLNGEVEKLSHDNLSVLGIGMDPRMGPENVRTSDFRVLFDRLRESFDVVVVDTGPLLASVEALPIVASADGVLLALRRGRTRRRLDECIQELRKAGASYLGVVLNCAERSDCERYTSVSRISAEVEKVSSRRQADQDYVDDYRSYQNALVRSMQQDAEGPSGKTE